MGFHTQGSGFRLGDLDLQLVVVRKGISVHGLHMHTSNDSKRAARILPISQYCDEKGSHKPGYTTRQHEY